ncbi:hypothetical protein CSC94_12760 [Zhengella mangrovi]|uniref:Cyanophage baseplate Pam3 plug gp18 domain-containing protein n=1 Tax=Zhengella mangrovi TaxID=1982044 RepID=A0A2G1QM54_9HYPH|nr:hypothetical protein [Zhengella mangrovi]PHP66554.1 hypothetical protein CSC94_12760 [Zhengella mangrovi]
MRQFTIIDAADQRFDTLINGKRVSIRLRYNVSTDRWTMDLAVSSTPVLEGRKIVPGVDLLGAFDLGLGIIFVSGEAAPRYSDLINGTAILYHADDADVAALNAA